MADPSRAAEGRCTRCGGPIVVGFNEPGPDETPAEGYSADNLDGLCWSCLEAVARLGEPAEMPEPPPPT